MILGIFMSATVKAAVHLGQDYQENPRTAKNTDFEQVKNVVPTATPKPSIDHTTTEAVF